MQTRHRTPTIFNLSMVDVLCCALGCVILLWLLNLREAKERAARAGQTSEELQSTQDWLNETFSLLMNSVDEGNDLARRVKATAKERDQFRRDLQLSRADLGAARQRLAALHTLLSDTEERLAKLKGEQRDLSKEKSVVSQRALTLERQLRDKESLAASSARRATDLAELLRDEEARAKKLQAQVDSFQARLTAAEARAREIEEAAAGQRRKLADADRSIGALERDKQALAADVNRARAAVENRFEGIALTGRRVLFLVDMSGSMDLVDEQTTAPNKWQGVRETLAKVMRSLPGLDKFQIILFSDKLIYPLGNEGAWMEFDAKASADAALRALAAVKPVGPTNMYDVFEAAFRFRDKGLDTIYVFSDGLPNIGPGLTPQQESSLKEAERSELLARHIRGLLRQNWNRQISGQPRVRINTIGFFFESPDVGAFLWALARENDGSFVGMSKP